MHPRTVLRALLVVAAVAVLTSAGVAGALPEPPPAAAEAAETQVGPAAVMALLDIRTLAGIPVEVADYGLSADGAAVEVRLAGAPDAPAVIALLAGLDPALLRLETGAAPPVRHGELRGGQPISGDRKVRCTLGFTATGDGGQDWVLTAGHCTRAADTWYDQQDQLIGSQARTARDLDVGAVPVTGRSTPAGPMVDTIPVAGAAPAPIGATVCLYGATSGRVCGQITARSRTVNFEGTALRGMTVAAVCARKGDSGGPYITADGQAQGLHSGGGSAADGACVGYFTPVDAALRAFGLTLRTRLP